MARETKERLRAAVLAARHARLSTRSSLDGAVSNLWPLVRELSPGGTLAAYVARSDEPDPGPLAAPAGIRLLLPRLTGGGGLAWVLAGDSLVPGLRGTREPPGPAVRGGLAVADLVVVPALAVDRAGVRLGRGGGSYDRALGGVRAGVGVVALLAADDELLDAGILPAEPHDVAVTLAATPSALHRLADLGSAAPSPAVPVSGPVS